MAGADMHALRDLVATAVPFAAYVGVEVLEVDAGRGRCRLTQVPHLGNHVGTLHAGALFTLAEAASGAAIVGLLGDRMAEVTPVARSAQIRYLKPARDTVLASAATAEPADELLRRVDADGRADTMVAVRIENEDGVLVCEMDVEWHLRRNG
jgi:uncharacterized protein (TIGR00369 family)